MKKRNVFVVMFAAAKLCNITTSGQCTLSLNPYIPICPGMQYPIPVAESLEISGGTAPFSYNWTCTLPGVLDDPTSQAPMLIAGVWDIDITITLTVTDSAGQTCQAQTIGDYSSFSELMDVCPPCPVEFPGPTSGPICLFIYPEHLPATYLWSPAEVFSDPVASNPIIFLQESMTWSVAITDAHGCTLSLGCDYLITGISEEEVITDFSIYPNPVSKNKKLYLTFPSGNNTTSNEIILTDIQGRQVYKHSASIADITTGRMEMDIRELASGVYVALWMDDGRWMDSVKVVVE